MSPIAELLTALATHPIAVAEDVCFEVSPSAKVVFRRRLRRQGLAKVRYEPANGWVAITEKRLTMHATATEALDAAWEAIK